MKEARRPYRRRRVLFAAGIAAGLCTLLLAWQLFSTWYLAATFLFCNGTQIASATSNRGVIYLCWIRSRSGIYWRGEYLSYYRELMESPWENKNLLGFNFESDHASGNTAAFTDQRIILQIPHWFPLLMTSALTPFFFKRANKRLLSHLCPHCHYDLRATPARCPECGHEPAPLIPTHGHP